MTTDTVFANDSQLWVTPDILAENRELVDLGAALHWLHPVSKRPIGDNWSEKPRADFERLARTYQSGNNVGIRLGEPSLTPAGHPTVIDVDVRDETKRDEAFAAVLEFFPNAFDLPHVPSGSGGSSRHFYFVAPSPLRSRKLAKSEGFTMVWSEEKQRKVKKHDWEIDLLSTGKQVVLPPSVHPDTKLPYKWLKPLDTFYLGMEGMGPEIDLERIKEPERKDEHFIDLLRERASGGDLRSALKFIGNHDDRDIWLEVAASLHHWDAGGWQGYRLWCEWSKISGKFEWRERKRTWQSLNKEYKGNPRTEASIFADAMKSGWRRPSIIEGWNLDEIFEDLPADLNDRYAMVRVGKDVQVVDRQADGLSLISVRAFRDLHAFQGRGDKWIKSEKRITFEGGLTFDPSGRVYKDKLNLWKGFAIEPDETGKCDLIVNHIRDVWASGDTAHFDYIVSWLADIVQNPAKKPRVALVLKGGKGAGKDSLVDLMRRIVGPRHYALANSPDVLTSNFNGLYDTALLIHAEESSWGGNKNAKGILQSLITNDTIRIERKNVDAVQIPSFHRVIFSTNEDWAVPATADERRYAVFNVSDHRIGDHDYFDALHRQIKGDGTAAFMAFLMAWKTPDGIRIGKPPQTRGLLDQKLAGLRNVEAWWFEKLCAGFTGCTEFGDDSEWFNGPLEIIKTDLHRDYCNWILQQRHHGESKVANKFGEALFAMCPMIETRRRRRTEVEGEGRQRSYYIPQLDECRMAFAGYMKADEAHFNWSGENG